MWGMFVTELQENIILIVGYNIHLIKQWMTTLILKS